MSAFTFFRPLSLVLILAPTLIASCSAQNENSQNTNSQNANSQNANSTWTWTPVRGERTKQELDDRKTLDIGPHRFGLAIITQGKGSRFDYMAFGKIVDGKLPAGTPIILQRAELADLPEDPAVPAQDYTYSMLRSQKVLDSSALPPVVSADGKTIWGTLAFYSKRHATDDKGSYLPQKQLLRFSFGYEVDAQTGDVLKIVRSPIHINQPMGNSSGDLGQVSYNGADYLVSAATSVGSILIYRLAPDLSDIAEKVAEIRSEAKDHREAPSLFRHGDMWYLHTSGTSGWKPNQHKYSYAPDLRGPWSAWLPIGDSTGFHSQVFGVARRGETFLFNGSRNGQEWGGSDNPNFPGINGKFPNIQVPIYFNTPQKLGVSYYNAVKENGQSIEVGQRPEGHKLDIAKISSTTGNAGLAALTDGDLNTAWSTDKAGTVLTMTLPQAEQVKVIKLQNMEFRGNYTRLISAAKIELGDEQGRYQTVYNNPVLQFTWLQSLPIPNAIRAKTKTIRITHLGSQLTSNSKPTNNWGFGEIEVWGGEAPPARFEKVNGAGVQTFEPITGTALTFSATLPAAQELPSQATISILAKSLAGTAGKPVCQFYLTKDTEAGTMKLSFRESPDSQALQPLGTALPGQELKVVINTDSRTYDVYLDDKVIWGGAELLSPERFIYSVAVGATPATTRAFPMEMSFRSGE